MYDMDKEALDFGGEATFFMGEWEKYNWINIFDKQQFLNISCLGIDFDGVIYSSLCLNKFGRSLPNDIFALKSHHGFFTKVTTPLKIGFYTHRVSLVHRHCGIV